MGNDQSDVPLDRVLLRRSPLDFVSDRGLRGQLPYMVSVLLNPHN